MPSSTLIQIQTLRDAQEPRNKRVSHPDSLEKLFHQISLMASEPITYGKKVYAPQVDTVTVTPSIFRRFVCADGCTACCQKITVDFLPSEYDRTKHGSGFVKHLIKVNGHEFPIYTDDQSQNPLCEHLAAIRPGGGLGCAHYPQQSLSCVSAPQFQFIQMREGVTSVMKKPYGRAWAMHPTPECEFHQFKSQVELERELAGNIEIAEKFLAWAAYFKIRTAFPQLRDFLESVRTSSRLYPATSTIIWERKKSNRIGLL